MLNKKIKYVLQAVVLILLALSCVACGSHGSEAEVPPVESTAMPITFTRTVQLEYVNDGSIPDWLWEKVEWSSDTLEMAYEDGSWENFSEPKVFIEGIAVFNASLGWSFDLYNEPAQERANYGRCYIVYEDAETRTLVDCMDFEDATFIRVSVWLVEDYCSESPSGMFCNVKDLHMQIHPDKSCVSFAAEETFYPKYRVWMEQITDFLGDYPRLLEDYKPGVLYTVCRSDN